MWAFFLCPNTAIRYCKANMRQFKPKLKVAKISFLSPIHNQKAHQSGVLFWLRGCEGF